MDNAPWTGTDPCSSDTGLLGAIESSRVRPLLSAEDDDWASLSKGVRSLGAAAFAALSLFSLFAIIAVYGVDKISQQLIRGKSALFLTD